MQLKIPHAREHTHRNVMCAFLGMFTSCIRCMSVNEYFMRLTCTWQVVRILLVVLFFSSWFSIHHLSDFNRIEELAINLNWIFIFVFMNSRCSMNTSTKKFKYICFLSCVCFFLLSLCVSWAVAAVWAINWIVPSIYEEKKTSTIPSNNRMIV